jgi:hypothetical protein
VSEYVNKGAILSTCGTYRYRLWREWRLGNSTQWDMWTDGGKPVVDGAGNQLGEPLTCLFVMLNPSTADGQTDDPTIRRCVAYAKAWGYDRMEVVNLFAHRATNPKQLLALGHHDEPWGVDNQRHIAAAVEKAGKIVCAWGAHGSHLGQNETVLGWLSNATDQMADEGREIPITALKLTKDGHPSHPLYLRADLKPFAFGGCA